MCVFAHLCVCVYVCVCVCVLVCVTMCLLVLVASSSGGGRATHTFMQLFSLKPFAMDINIS